MSIKAALEAGLANTRATLASLGGINSAVRDLLLVDIATIQAAIEEVEKAEPYMWVAELKTQSGETRRFIDDPKRSRSMPDLDYWKQREAVDPHIVSVKWLYAHPQQHDEADARDAARWRWLRMHSFFGSAYCEPGAIHFGGGFNQPKPELLDAAIDQAIRAGRDGGGK